MTGSVTFDCYVANLPLHYTETEVRDIFGIAGEIVGVKILPAKACSDGKVAFVRFTEESDAHCCAQYMNNYEFEDGRTLKVRYKPKSLDNNGPVKTNGFYGSMHSPVQSTVTHKKEENELEEVFVSHVESPIEFWGQSCTELFATQLEELTDKMATVCDYQPKVIGNISTEEVYGCKFSEDDLWYRCVVEKSLAKNEVHVRYIDYGNGEVTDRTCLITLPNGLATLPAMCRRYHIDGLDLTITDIKSELYEKGLDVLIDLINEEKVSLKVIRKDENVTLVKIYQNADGALLDIPSKLMTTGCVKVKTVGQGLSFATAVKTPVKSTQNGLDSFPKASPFSTNGNGISSLKSAFNHILPDSPVKTTPNQAWPIDSPSKSNQNNIRPTDLPLKPSYNHINSSESPVRTTFNSVGSIQSPDKTIPNGVRLNSPLEKNTQNYIRPNNLPMKTMSSPGNTSELPAIKTNSLGAVGSPVKPLDWFADPPEPTRKSLPDSPEKNIFSHVEPSLDIEIKKTVVKKTDSSESKESPSSDVPSKRIVPEKQKSEESLEEETMSAELYREKINNSANIIEQLKRQLEEKTNILEGYLHTPADLNNSLLSTKACSDSVNGATEENIILPSHSVSSIHTNTEAIAVESKGTHMIIQNDDEIPDVIPNVTCKDVGGYKKELDEIKSMIDLPLSHSELFKEIGFKPPRGVLLSGPHGVGKTLMARAVANERNIFVKEIFGPNVICGSIEDANRKLNKVFKQVIMNAPSVLILDQIDVIAPKKESGKNKMVAKMLSLLSQLKHNVVILSTAVRSNDVDPLLKRGGLFDKEVNICKPDTATRLEILNVLSSKLSLSKSVFLNKISEETVGYVGSNLSALCSLAIAHGMRTKLAAVQTSNKEKPVTFKQITLNVADFKHSLEVLKSYVQTPVTIPTTTWDDIVGMEDVKNELKSLVNTVASGEEKLIDTGVPSKGLLFCGPHGCGKNMFAKALGNSCKCKFISVKGHELCTANDSRGMYLADLFDKARSNKPCMLYIDEIEHITSSNENLLSELLQEIDGIGATEKIFVIGATSRPSDVHTAFRRKGRLQYIAQIPLPDEKTRQAILEKGLIKETKSEEINSNFLENLAIRLEGYTCDDLRNIIRRVCKIASEENIACSHFDAALKITRRSVTDDDMVEFEEFFESHRTTDTHKFTNEDEETDTMDEADENEDNTEIEIKEREFNSNMTVAHNNNYLILLGLFTIACFIYILGLYIYTTIRY